ncbi:unnamed protein product [Brassica oleracea var. botrytis]|uniref:Uncharacterized protein n=2 Tax=Brassica TaxID=3705 RepID=A0A0D3A5R8_BRAOL|nr:hypothetical protein HID58_041609 [Brassica napus]CAF2071262.1 unnamed protein product [Brassica napus]
MNVVHGLKRIPRIKFPQRHLKPSEGTKQVENEADTFFFSNLNTPKTTIGGKASLQPKRTPVSNEEMQAILVLGRLHLIIEMVWTSSLPRHSQNILTNQDLVDVTDTIKQTQFAVFKPFYFCYIH